MFSKQNGMKSQSNSIRPFGKLTDTWKLNNTFLNHQWVKEEITMEIKKNIWEGTKIQRQHMNICGMQLREQRNF